MRDVQTVFKNNFFEIFKFKRYNIFSWWFRIIVTIIMLPFILVATILGIWYQLGIFGLKIAQIVPSYIKETIDENKVTGAALFVVYFVAYPIKFFFDFLIALQMIFLALQHFLFVSFAYIASFGGIKYQPYLVEADGIVEKETPTYKLSWVVEAIISAIIVVVTALFIFIPMINSSIAAKNERIDIVSQKVSTYLVDEGFEDSYEIEEAFYFTDSTKTHFAIVQIRYKGSDYFIQVFKTSVTKTLTLSEYNGLKNSNSHDKRHKMNTKKLTEAVDGRIY